MASSSHIMLLVGLVILACWVQHTYSLDVNWLPADADGPLPQSEKYRSSLRQLCQRLEAKDSQAFAKDVISQRPYVKTMCKRLAEDDLAIGGGSGGNMGADTFASTEDRGSSKVGIVVSSAVAIAVLVYALNLDQPIKKLWYSFTGQGRYTGPVVVHRGEVGRPPSVAGLPKPDTDGGSDMAPTTNDTAGPATASVSSIRGGYGGSDKPTMSELRELRLRKL